MSYLGISRLHSGSTMHLSSLVSILEMFKGNNKKESYQTRILLLWAIANLLQTLIISLLGRTCFIYSVYSKPSWVETICCWGWSLPSKWKVYSVYAKYMRLSSPVPLVYEDIKCHKRWYKQRGSLCCSPLHQNICQELHLCWKTAIVCSGNGYSYLWTMMTFATICKPTYH